MYRCYCITKSDPANPFADKNVVLSHFCDDKSREFFMRAGYLVNNFIESCDR